MLVRLNSQMQRRRSSIAAGKLRPKSRGSAYTLSKTRRARGQPKQLEEGVPLAECVGGAASQELK